MANLEKIKFIDKNISATVLEQRLLTDKNINEIKSVVNTIVDQLSSYTPSISGNYLSAVNPSGTGTLIIDNINSHKAFSDKDVNLSLNPSSIILSTNNNGQDLSIYIPSVSGFNFINTIIGANNEITGSFNTVFGLEHTVYGNVNIVQGTQHIISANYCHVEGCGNQSYTDNNHVEGQYNIIISGQHSHAEGAENKIYVNGAHAEGQRNEIYGKGGHAEGLTNKVSGQYAHAEGNQTAAIGNYSLSLGEQTKAVGNSSISFGSNTIASGDYSLAGGLNSVATKKYSLAFGEAVSATNSHATALGFHTLAKNSYSIAEGSYTRTSKQNQHVFGKYNADYNGPIIVGNGTAENDRKNIFTIDWNGTISAANNILGADIYSNGINLYDYDIKSINFNPSTNKLFLTRQNGNELSAEIKIQKGSSGILYLISNTNALSTLVKNDVSGYITLKIDSNDKFLSDDNGLKVNILNGPGISINGNTISGKINTNNNEYLELTSDGFRVNGVNNAIINTVNTLEDKVSTAFNKNNKVIISKSNGITASQFEIGGETFSTIDPDKKLATQAGVKAELTASVFIIKSSDTINIDGDYEKIISLNINNTDKVLTHDSNGLFTNIELKRNDEGKSSTTAARYILVGKNNQQLGVPIDIPKDQFLSGVSYNKDKHELTFVMFLSGKPSEYTSATIDLNDLVNIYQAASGIQKLDDGKTFIGKLNSIKNNEGYLTLSKDGFAVEGINTALSNASGCAYSQASIYVNNKFNNLSTVTSLNGLTGSLNLIEGNNINISKSGKDITIGINDEITWNQLSNINTIQCSGKTKNQCYFYYTLTSNIDILSSYIKNLPDNWSIVLDINKQNTNYSVKYNGTEIIPANDKVGHYWIGFTNLKLGGSAAEIKLVGNPVYLS